MWQLVNQTPYAAERCFARDRDGAELWVVAVKGTFDILSDGSTRLSEPQEEVCKVPRFHGEPGKSSLMYEGELISGKQATDVILHGSARAPGGRPVTQLDIAMRVGSLTKVLRVFGERRWRKRVGLGLTSPEPFVEIPIVYEHAFGGVDSEAAPRSDTWERRNPIGTGFASSPDRLVGQRAPCIEDPRFLINTWTDRPPPAGFGPLCRDWSPRRERAGTYDAKWQQDRQPLVPLDFDDRFHQCAPDDQQVPGHLRGGEPVTLLNVGPREELCFALPRVWLVFSTRLGRQRVEHRARLYSVIIEPDAPRVMMVWATSVPCQNREHMLEQTTIREKQFI
ncbi:DUF2169 family type VI secretion system accessory protein [Archangium violaceum]|uniref:DUF2169 family type VI secretion system accessory protein n=1 Tax=Archangium violaceum TaxID=83451 RepID=UPI0036D9F1C7